MFVSFKTLIIINKFKILFKFCYKTWDSFFFKFNCVLTIYQKLVLEIFLSKINSENLDKNLQNTFGNLVLYLNFYIRAYFIKIVLKD